MKQVFKFVKSLHPCKSPPERLSRAGVIQTSYDNVKANAGEIKVDSEAGKGSTFGIILKNNLY